MLFQISKDTRVSSRVPLHASNLNIRGRVTRPENGISWESRESFLPCSHPGPAASQGQNLALSVALMPYSLDNGLSVTLQRPSSLGRGSLLILNQPHEAHIRTHAPPDPDAVTSRPCPTTQTTTNPIFLTSKPEIFNLDSLKSEIINLQHREPQIINLQHPEP